MYKQYNQIFEEYTKANITDYALFLNGEWGSGKTYYINNELTSILKSNNLIYCSLNGANDIKSIKQQIFFSYLNQEYDLKVDTRFLDTMLDISKNIPLFGISSFSSILKKTKDSFEEGIISKVDFSNKILIFDDLERISESISIQNLLGFIFDNFISKNVKVIVVGFEKEIIKNLCENFYEIKEKYFRRTIQFCPNRGKFCFEFINKRYENHSTILIPLFNMIMNNYPNIYEKNLRTLSFIIDNYLTILDNQKNLIMKNNLQETIFYYIYTISVEFKKGHITSNDLVNYKHLDKILENKLLFYYKKKEDRDKSYDEIFYDKYLHNKKIPFYFIKSIFDYIVTGYLDKDSLQLEIKYLSKDFSREKKVLNKFYNYYEYEFSELMQIINQLLLFIADNKYNLSQLISIYRYFCYINENNLLTDQGVKFNKCITIAVNIQIENNAFETFNYNTYFSPNESDNYAGYQELKKHIKDSQNKYLSLELKERISKITEYANTNSSMFFIEFNSFNNQISLLNSLIETETVNYFSSLNIRGLYCYGSILTSHLINVSNAGDCYSSIKPRLMELSEHFSKFIQTLSPSTYIFKKTVEFKEIIDNSIKHLVTTNKND